MNIDGLAVIILSHSQYGRYRAVLKRISGREKEWMNNSLIVALGGFTTPTRRTYVLFCRDNFDYAELEEHPYLCNHLGRSTNFKFYVNTYKLILTQILQNTISQWA